MIYPCSKIKYANFWRAMALDYPIRASWITAPADVDTSILWPIMIREASEASALVCFRQGDEQLKGGLVEIGAALAVGVPVFAVGLEGTIRNHPGIQHMPDLYQALVLARIACYVRGRK